MESNHTRSDGYAPDFDFDLKRGAVGEDLLDSVLGNLNGSSIEVKTDYRAAETGNVYIECYSYRTVNKADLKPSGISTSKADWWCFASPVGNGFVMIRLEDLKSLVTEYYTAHRVVQPIFNEKTSASIGVALPMKVIMRKVGLLNELERN